MAGQKAMSRYKICILTEAASLAERWAGRGARRQGVRGARGAQAGHSGSAGGALGALGAGEPPVRAWMCCWANRLCTWCTQPVLT